MPDLFKKMQEDLGVNNPRKQLIDFLEDELNISISQRGARGGGGAAAPLIANLIWYEEGSLFFRTTNGNPIKVIGRTSINKAGISGGDIQYSLNGGTWTALAETLGAPLILSSAADEIAVRLINVNNLVALPFRIVLKLEAA